MPETRTVTVDIDGGKPDGAVRQAMAAAGEPTEIGPTSEESHNERAMAIVRLIVSVVTIINIVAAQFGWAPLGLDSELLYTVISGGFAIAASIWAWWKNNNMTEAAQAAQNVLDLIKHGDRP